MLANWPPSRRIAVAALVSLCVGLFIVALAQGFSSNLPLRLAQVLACAVVVIVLIGMVLGAVTGRLSDYREPADDAEFERLLRRSEELARQQTAEEPGEDDFLDDELSAHPGDGALRSRDPYDPRVFATLVREALDDLPDLLLRALDRVAVVVSDEGRRHQAYGLYEGDTVARDQSADRIVIFRDTLLRDFGDDPDELRAEVTRTVRHELAHHLGADELGVRDLGL